MRRLTAAKQSPRAALQSRQLAFLQPYSALFAPRYGIVPCFEPTCPGFARRIHFGHGLDTIIRVVILTPTDLRISGCGPGAELCEGQYADADQVEAAFDSFAPIAS